MKHETRTAARALLGSAMAAAAMLVAPLGGTAQDANMDGRWFPWLGCWESQGEDADGSMLCVQPLAGEDAVEVLTVVDGDVLARERLSADGTGRNVDREGCSGVETARFSDDASRIFVHSDLTCGNVGRTTDGLMAMISPAHWIDVQTVDVGGRSAAWVQHYRLASQERADAAGFGSIARGYGMAVESGRMMAAAPASIDDVIEASQEVGGPAVEAWLAQLNDRFDLSAAELVRMADAGVPENVIDVIVAVSYPERFAVDNGAERYADRGVPAGYGGRGWYGGRSYYRPYYYDSFYSPWGYGYGGWGYTPTVVIVEPRPGNDGSGGHGQVVNGRGYTRNRGSTPVSRPSAGGSTGASRPSGSSAGASTGRSTGSSAGSSTGRTAKQRGGGGG